MRWLGRGLGLALAVALVSSCATTRAEPAPRVRERVVFYDELSPYGAWIVVHPFGRVWQPYHAFVGPGFMPYYSGGYWLETPDGWVFESDYPFGWAVYHYGRWAYVPGPGWVWIPGHEWAPSWVMWRYGGGYVGWYPMPPPGYSMRYVGYDRWIFIDAYGFGRHDHHHYVVPPRYRARAYHAASPIGGNRYHAASAGPPVGRYAERHAASGGVYRPPPGAERGRPGRDATALPPGAAGRDEVRVPPGAARPQPRHGGDPEDRGGRPGRSVDPVDPGDGEVPRGRVRPQGPSSGDVEQDSPRGRPERAYDPAPRSSGPPAVREYEPPPAPREERAPRAPPPPRRSPQVDTSSRADGPPPSRYSAPDTGSHRAAPPPGSSRKR